VGALIEIEFCKKLIETCKPNLKYYGLGELVNECSKVNYKLAYKPGEVLCPYSNIWIPYQDALPEINKLSAMTRD